MIAIRKAFVLAGCAFLVAATLPVGEAHAQKRRSAPSYAECEDGQQDRAACRREMGAVRQRAPEDPAVDFNQVALRRCGVHRDPEARQSCEERVRRGQHTQSQGSVMGGGQLHEHRYGTGVR